MSQRLPTDPSVPRGRSAVLDGAGDGVVTLARDGTTVGVSAGVCAMTGYAADHLIGLPACVLPLWPRFSADGERLRAALAVVLDDGTPGRVAIALRRRDGSSLPVIVRLQPMLRPDGGLEGAAATVASAAPRQDPPAGAPSMLKVTEPDGGLTYADAAWLGFRGARLAEELGQGWLAGVHPDDRAAVAAAQRAALEDGRPVEIRYRLRDAEGVHRRVLDRCAPRVDPETGAALGLVGTVTCATEERRPAEPPDAAGADSRDASVMLEGVRGAQGIVDDLRVLSADARAAAILGGGADGVIGRGIRTLVPSGAAARLLADAVRALESGATIRREERCAAFGAEGRVVAMEVAPLAADRVLPAWAR